MSLREGKINHILPFILYFWDILQEDLLFKTLSFWLVAYYQQCLNFLMAGKCDGESIPILLLEHRHVELLDCGGLSRVTSNVRSISEVGECYFKFATQKPTTKINCQTIVSSLMTNITVLTHAAAICNKSSDLIKNEMALNLVKDILTLYIRVRSFSFAKDQQRSFKIRQAKLKSRSLRTELKRTSAVLKYI